MKLEMGIGIPMTVMAGGEVIPLIWHDTFTDDDGVALSAHVPDLRVGTGAAYNSYSMVVSANKANITLYTNAYAYYNPQLTKFQAKLKYTSLVREGATFNEYPKFFFRVYNTASSYWYARLARGNLNPVIYTVQIHEVQLPGPVDTLHTSELVSGIADGVEYDWEIQSYDDTVKVYFEGSLITQKTDATTNKTSTMQGLGFSSGVAPAVAAKFDDLDIYDLS
jgi:hypothetical protein